LRTFYKYDDNAVVIEEIVDDGFGEFRDDLQGVTKRLIKRIVPQETFPIGLPWVIDESYWDVATASEVSLSRIVNSYNPQGLLVRQEHHGSDGVRAYTLEWGYDEHGNVSLEKNALGETFLRRYDANNNLIWEQGPRTDFYKEYAYDFSNRLITDTEVHASGARLAKSFRYDYLGRCLASIDVYGNETGYGYDLLGRRTHVLPPVIRDTEGTPVSTALITEYDLLGNAITKSDARTFSTHSSYNIRGQPTDIIHPDGTQESFRYFRDGVLQWHTAADGTKTRLRYDYQKRVVVREQRDATDAVINRTKYRYDAFHLLEEYDSHGHSTKYRYDGAGRLIQQVADGQKTTFAYDVLGRQHITKTFFGPGSQEYVAKVVKYDLLDRVVEERTEDAFGAIQSKVGATYDCMGNCSSTISYGAGGTAKATTEYTQSGQAARWVDALGNVTWKAIYYGSVNALGQRVRYEEIIDATGLANCQEYDAIGRLAISSSRALWGGVIARSEFFYDCDGNLTRQIDTAYNPVDGAIFSSHITRRSYDSCSRLTALHEGVGSPESRITQIIYNSLGQKQAVLYPDGIALHMQYDPAGRLKSRFSSDGSVYDTFVYDGSGNIIDAIDNVNGWTTRRSYNKRGHITDELLGNGLQMQFQADLIGRPLTVIMPDNSAIRYRYSGAQIATIDRLGKDGALRYTHSYNSYDLSGKVVTATLIGIAGKGAWEYDKLGRGTRITTDSWHEAIGFFDGAGNLKAKYTRDPIKGGFGTQYDYDALHQLEREQGGPVIQEHSSDSLHNRRKKNGVAAKFSSCHELLNDGESSYAYDKRGNLIRETKAGVKTTYGYDALNRMTSVTKGGLRTTYTYDPFHRRIVKMQWQGGEGAWQAVHCQRMAYHGENEVGIFDTLGQAQAVRVLGISLRGGAEIGAAVAIELLTKAFAPIHDLQGNVCCLIDSSTGAVAATYRYSAYGEKEENLVDSVCASNPWQWMSKSFDPETGFLFFGRRYYSAATARWTTTDPMGHLCGPNLYAYVHNRPLHLLDLYGLMPQEGDAEGGGGGGEGVVDDGNNFFKMSMGKIGNFVSDYGKHWVGIPVLRDIYGFTGHILSGNDPQTYVMSYREQHSSNFSVGEFDVPGRRLMLVNGILCSKEEMMARGQECSKMLGGERVYVSYNATHGITMDLLETFAQKLGIPTHSCSKLERQARKCLNAVGKDGQVWILAHSQGVEITWGLQSRLSSSEMQQIHVCALGGARIIPRGFFKEAVNFASKRDAVPAVADLSGYLFGIAGIYDLTLLESDNYPFIDHAL